MFKFIHLCILHCQQEVSSQLLSSREKWITLHLLLMEVAEQHASLMRISWNSVAPQAIVHYRNILTEPFWLATLGQR